MHPNLYGNLSRISDLNQLAQLGGDWDWETRYNYSVFTPGTVLGLPPHLALAAFQKVSGKVQTCSNFGRLQARVENSSSFLCFGFRCRGVHMDQERETKVVVGRITASSEYDIRSQTDPYFKNNADETLLSTEVKTARTFPHVLAMCGTMDHVWHHGSRSSQTFTALFARNAPTVLLNQRQWKLIVENADRSAVHTFPYEDDDTDDPGRSPFLKSTLVKMMGTTLLKVIFICALAKPGRPADEGQLKPPATPPAQKSKRRAESHERLPRNFRARLSP